MLYNTIMNDKNLQEGNIEANKSEFEQWRVFTTLAKDYCTKDDANKIEKRLDKRIDDFWKILGFIVLILVAILSLVAVIFANLD